MNNARLAMMRAIAIGGTSFSVAVALAITQIGVTDTPRAVALFCSCVSIPTWVAVWRIGEVYSVFGKAGLGHFSTLSGSGLHLLLFGIAGVSLVVSFTALVWSFSILSSTAFVVASMASMLLIYFHQIRIQNWAEKQDDSGT